MSSETSHNTPLEHPVRVAQNHSEPDCRALIVAARHDLIEEVVEFLRRMKRRGEKELGRNPYSEDLLPFFQKYAWRVIEVRDKEVILAASSLKEARERIQSAIGRLLNEICKRRELVQGKTKPAGIWIRTVMQARRAADFNIAITPFGEYDYRIFLYPKRRQLGVLLRVQATMLEQEFFDNAKNRQDSALKPSVELPDTAKRRTGNRKFSRRADWLRRHMLHLGLSVAELAQSAKLNEKTIRNARNGHSISEGTQKVIIDALSTKGPKISYDEIPNC